MHEEYNSVLSTPTEAETNISAKPIDWPGRFIGLYLLVSPFYRSTNNMKKKGKYNQNVIDIGLSFHSIPLSSLQVEG